MMEKLKPVKQYLVDATQIMIEDGIELLTSNPLRIRVVPANTYLQDTKDQAAIIKRLEATLDGDPNETETPEQRRRWRHSAVMYADKLEAEKKRLRLVITDLSMALDAATKESP